MSNLKKEIREIELEKLVGLEALKGRYEFQLRDELKNDVVTDYREIIRHDDSELPPITVFERADGKFIIADGYYRYRAHKGAGKKTIKAEVLQGNEEDIIFKAINENFKNGQSLTISEKRKCVSIFLELDISKNMSDRAIGRLLRVSNHLIPAVRNNTACGKNLSGKHSMNHDSDEESTPSEQTQQELLKANEDILVELHKIYITMKESNSKISLKLEKSFENLFSWNEKNNNNNNNSKGKTQKLELVKSA